MLTQATLSASLLELQQRFAWQEQASAYALVASWKSRTARLYHLSGTPGRKPNVVVKVFDEPAEHPAPALDQTARTLGETFTGDGEVRTRVPAALGWTSSPAAVYAEHVDGVEVIRMFADLSHPLWRSSGWDPVRLAAECGRTLAVYHRIEHPDPLDGSGTDFEEAARAMRLNERARAALLGWLTPVPTFGDYGPHQLMVRADGALFLLDAPARPTLGSAHGDLARFLFGLGKALARNQGGAAGQREALRSAFIDGYADAGLNDPRTGEGRRMLMVFEGAIARGVARQRWSIGRRAEAARYARRWVAGVLALKR